MAFRSAILCLRILALQGYFAPCVTDVGIGPTYKALVELGKARRTIFLCRYLWLPELRREIQEGLNVIENWNSANDFILIGNGSDIAANRREDQEVTMLRQTLQTKEIHRLVDACYTRYRHGFVTHVQKGDVPSRYESLARYWPNT